MSDETANEFSSLCRTGPSMAQIKVHEASMTPPILPTHQPVRTLCLRCLRSQLTCYCKQVRPFRSKLQFVILQHPLEHRNSIGTARITHHCLENSQLIAGLEFGENVQVNELIADPENYCVVLYPGPNSRNISEQGSGLPVDKKGVIFVIDGTWSCAKKMVHRSPNLSRLPQICFTPQKPSEYRIRQQPKAYCLSTLEAVHQVLEILNPEVGRDNLLEVFRSMIEKQVWLTTLNRAKRPELV
jgi:DTW domain-containing protein